LGALLQGTGLGRAQDDTYSVHDYVLSRDALRELDDKLKVRAAYSDTSVDFFNRFPGLQGDESFEALHRYYLKHVVIEYDATSSISVLRTRAYNAQHAKDVNELLLQMGERLVNSLNTRSRQDLVEVAQKEVTLAEERTRAAAASLSSFRADRGVFDPDRQSAMQLQGVAKLQEELFAAETQLAQLRQVSPNNPQVAGMASRVEALRRQAASETSKVTGRAGSSLTAKSPGFDRLALEKGFADRQLATALASLESARSEAARKQLYLERLVQPNLPDKAMEPRRLRSVAMVLLLGLVCWGVLSLVVASVREHTD
ncbi:MAG: hypothetical protein Q8M96_07190, partial [Rubrivivax sp.]|nr:hypothetical protein [Rubrivivax sp.]